MIPTKKFLKTFTDSLVFTESCWLFKKKTDTGYGKIYCHSVGYFIHRLSYAWFVGPIPKGAWVHHLCINRSCANPAHLKSMSPYAHLHEHKTWHNKYRTHCKYGHPFSGDNLKIYSRPNGRQSRTCLTCERKRKKLNWQKELIKRKAEL